MEEERDNCWSTHRISRRAALRGAGLGVAGLAGAAVIGCGGDDDEAPSTQATGEAAATTTEAPSEPLVKRGGTWSAVSASDPPTIDPYGNLSFRTKNVAAFPYSRLYQLAPPGGLDPVASATQAAPTPDIAESAETADGLSWIVRLRPGVMFHNVAPRKRQRVHD